MKTPPDLLGIGLYTPSEAGWLLGISPAKISRWLLGHQTAGRNYTALWASQVDIGDGKLYLGFRDLMELRTANAFIGQGVSAVTVRRAIVEAQRLLGDERPLSTTRFKTDGHSVFLELVSAEGDTRLLDIFKRQYAFKKIIEASLKDVEFESDAPSRWWPSTKAKGIVLDPSRSFGQPIDHDSGVPTAHLAAAASAEGSIDAAARIWEVSALAVRRAVDFESSRQLLAA